MNAVETVDVTKPAEMIGSLWMWFHDGVLYRCASYDAPIGTYTFKGVADSTKEVDCLYSFVGFKMMFVKGKRGT